MINDFQISETTSVPQILNHEEDEANLAQFHIFKNDNIKGPNDVLIRDYIKQNNHLFILGRIPYFYSNGCYRPNDQGHLLKKKIEQCLYREFRKAPTINRIYDLFIIDDDLNMTEKDLNKQPACWISFQNGYFDPIENRMVPHDPNYFTTSQVVASYDPKEKSYLL